MFFGAVVKTTSRTQLRGGSYRRNRIVESMQFHCAVKQWRMRSQKSAVALAWSNKDKASTRPKIHFQLSHFSISKLFFFNLWRRSKWTSRSQALDALKKRKHSTEIAWERNELLSFGLFYFDSLSLLLLIKDSSLPNISGITVALYYWHYLMKNCYLTKQMELNFSIPWCSKT